MQTITQNLTMPLITRNKLLLLFAGMAILLWSRGFNLRVLDISERFEVFVIASVFLITAAFVVRAPSIFIGTGLKGFYPWAIFGLIAIVFLAIFFNSVIVAGHGMIELPRQGFRYAALLICLVMISCRTDSSFVPNLNAVVVGISSANVLFLVAVSFLPGVASSLLIKVASRLGVDRFESPLTAMVLYSSLYCLVMCTTGARSTKVRAFFLALFVTYLWYFVFVSMGRRTILAVMVVFGLYWLFHLKIGRKTIVLLLALVLLGASTIFLNNQVFDVLGKLLSSSVENFQGNKGTIAIRIEGISFFMNRFVDNGCIGIGPATHSHDAMDIWNKVPYNPHDHGLIAVLYQYGFQGILLTVVILYLMFRDLRAVRRFGPRQYQPIAMAISLYLYCTLVGLMQIYWKPPFALWTGIMLFMTWRMHDEIRRNRPPVQKQNRFPVRAVREEHDV